MCRPAVIGSKPSRIEYDDLIGLPYLLGGDGRDGIDCIGLVRLALERAGAPLEAQDMPSDESGLGALLLREALHPSDMPWRRVDARDVASWAVGDVVLQDHGGAHVGIVVESPRQMVLSAAAPVEREGRVVRPGKSFAMPGRRLRCVAGVYRLRRWGA